LTKESSTLGTVHYMSPEQTMGKEVDQRTDIWSLGVLLYEMLTGRLPFQGDYEQAVIYAILNEEPVPLDSRQPDVPTELKVIIHKCLEKEIDVRYQHADDLLADLKRAKRDSKPVAVTAGKTNMPGRSRKALWPIAAAVMALIFALAFLVLKPFKAKPKETASEADLLPNRYYMAILENQTGDSSLDSLGRMAADWITQGLSQLGRHIEPVVAQETVAAAQVQKTAEKGRAGKFIGGAYYLSGESLQFQVRIMDTASGNVDYALPPVSGSRQDPMKVVNLLSQRLTGSLAMRHELEMPPSLMIEPPLFEAYQEFMAGVNFFGSNDDEAVAHFQKAAELDPKFFRPKLYIALTYSNRGDYAEAEAVLKQILDQKNQFSLVERHTLDWYAAHLQGNILKAYRSVRLAADLAPGNWIFNYLVGLYAQRSNHPQETVDSYFWYQQGKTLTHPKTSQSWWYEVLAESHHMLGNFERELEVSREGKRLFPDNIDYHFIDARALAARGDVEGARKKIEECFAFPISRLHMSQGLLSFSLELRVHGHVKEGREVARQAAAWLRQKENEKALTSEESFNLARIMAAAEQWDDAEKLATSLASQDPKNVGCAGLLGVLHARRGNGAKARKISEKLQGSKQPYLFGEHTLWRARIAAQVGEKEEALRLLREAFAQGNAFGVWLHRDIYLEPLRGFPAYEGFAQPQAETVDKEK
jgi:tetratricopeptide (TPR) repeat protein